MKMKAIKMGYLPIDAEAHVIEKYINQYIENVYLTGFDIIDVKITPVKECLLIAIIVELRDEETNVSPIQNISIDEVSANIRESFKKFNEGIK